MEPVLQPYGSRTTSSRKSGSMGEPSARRGGHGRCTRINPWSSSSECEARSSCGSVGQFEPSTAANNGSRPPVVSHRRRAVAADRLIESAGWWQVTQARPFGPSGVKNGWPRVSSAPPSSDDPPDAGRVRVVEPRGERPSVAGRPPRVIRRCNADHGNGSGQAKPRQQRPVSPRLAHRSPSTPRAPQFRMSYVTRRPYWRGAP